MRRLVIVLDGLRPDAVSPSVMPSLDALGRVYALAPIVAGPGVTRRHHLTRAISLLDIPATVLWWFGVPVLA